MTWRDRFSIQWLFDFPEEGSTRKRYSLLRRNMIILMILVTIIPLFFMALVNYHQYQTTLRDEIVNPMPVLVNKTKHSFELFLAERLSAVSFIASAYSYEKLTNEAELNRVFRAMKREFGGFVDLGLIDESGAQVSYVGPYDLKGKNYSEQSWFHETQVRGGYVSDVFMGFRGFPHIVMAVLNSSESSRGWILRATIDTDRFHDLIGSMGLDARTDAFLINKRGVLQTSSKWYGAVLDKLPFALPPPSFEANVLEVKDPDGRDMFMAYTHFAHAPYILVVLKPKGAVLHSWYTLKSELFFLFVTSVLVIFLVVFKLTDLMVRRMRECDERREAAFREIEHTHKLSSIGRLAAGVAHEINNPMAIINEKAGLMRDLIDLKPEFPDREKFLALVNAVLQSVHRCRSITHRLLGFARRMEVQIEVLDLNEVIQETATFLEKEALYRKIQIKLQLDLSLPRIASDRGQLQQVFLNILNNALAAVADGGQITVTTRQGDEESNVVVIQDNGCGMSESTLQHIFEPFFTTRKGKGTGLGLPITYGIVKKLGGDIEVQSQEGVGTTFTITLPQKAGEGSEG